jgi:hypothetical protein
MGEVRASFGEKEKFAYKHAVKCSIYRRGVRVFG